MEKLDSLIEVTLVSSAAAEYMVARPLYVADPVSGKPKAVRRIEFADGTVCYFPAPAEDAPESHGARRTGGL